MSKKERRAWFNAVQSDPDWNLTKNHHALQRYKFLLLNVCSQAAVKLQEKLKPNFDLLIFARLPELSIFSSGLIKQFSSATIEKHSFHPPLAANATTQIDRRGASAATLARQSLCFLCTADKCKRVGGREDGNSSTRSMDG